MAEFDIQQYSEQYLAGYANYSGLTIESLEEGKAVISITIEEQHLNPYRTVHGGCIFTLADTTGGIAIRTLGYVPTTCAANISYLRPTMDCKKLTAVAEVVKAGANTDVVDVHMYDDKEVLVAQVTGTYFNLKIADPGKNN